MVGDTVSAIEREVRFEKFIWTPVIVLVLSVLAIALGSMLLGELLVAATAFYGGFIALSVRRNRRRLGLRVCRNCRKLRDTRLSACPNCGSVR